MKPGDVVMIFGNPFKREYPIDQAKLIQKKRDVGRLEEWWVVYLDDPDHQYTALIQNDNGTNDAK